MKYTLFATFLKKVQCFIMEMPKPHYLVNTFQETKDARHLNIKVIIDKTVEVKRLK